MNDNIKTQLKALIMRRLGRNNPVSRQELHQHFPDISDRTLRQIIHELRREDTPILFATRKPSGYYIPANPTEQQEGMATLKSYIIDLCITRNALKRNAAKYFIGSKQPSLF